MYNFNLEKDETLVSVFDDVLVSQNNNSKLLSVAVTNKRILFLDFQSVEPYETLKGAQASSYIKFKEVVYSRYLNEIKSATSNTIKFNDIVIELDNLDIVKTIKEL